MSNGSDVLIVGSGLFGAVIAERLATDAGIKVCVIDKRSHIGGNCHSHVDAETKVECHCYGPHIFHTSNERVWDYVNRFTRFNGYQHVVHTKHRNRVFTMPINLGTINAFYGCHLSPEDAEAFVRQEVERAGIKNPDNFEDKAISLIGRPLYEAFINGYTFKQWGVDPRQLSADIVARLPVRFNYNTRYYDDCYEGVPWDGYTRFFERLLDHPNIEIRLDTDYFTWEPSRKDVFLTVYTGPIDRYFNFSEGRLGWRSLRFEVQRHALPDYQGCSVMNYADPEIPFTRITEFKHFHPERPRSAATITYKEFSYEAGPDDEPYYPVNTPRNMDLLKKYQSLDQRESRVIFGGRLGSYQYFDMDDAVASALACYETSIRPLFSQRSSFREV